MSVQLPVYVIGFSDVYQNFFNAIAATVGSHDYGVLIKLMFLLGGSWVLIQSSIKQHHFVNLTTLYKYLIITSIVLVPNCMVIINDQTQNNVYSVEHIPLGLGILASVTTRVGLGFTQLVEKVFHTPSDLTYTRSGMLMGAKMIEASQHFQVVGSDFQQNLQQFVHQCVFYDVLLRKYTLQDLVNAPNLWRFVSANASPARAFMYNGTVVTCKTGAAQLSQAWHTALKNATTAYANRLWVNNKNAEAELLSYLPLSYQTLANVSDSAANLMQQSMMMNAIQNGIGSWAAHINAKGALQDFAMAKAQAQKREGYHLLFKLAVYWLPLTQTVMQLVLMGSFLIIVLFAFFPLGGGIVRNYVMTFVWLQLWAPIFAFENFILTLYGEHSLSSSTVLMKGTHALTLSTFSSLNQMNADLGNVAGFFVALTPIIAVGLFKGMMSVFTQAANYIGGATQSAAFTAAGEATTGNLSLGNTQFASHSAFNTSMGQLNTNPQVASGMMSYQLPGGGNVSVAANGERILQSQGGISHLPVTPNMAESMQSSFSTMADRAESTAFRDMDASQTAYSSGIRDLYELGQTQSHSTQSGLSSNTVTSGTFSQSAREVHQLVNRFAKDNNISHSESAQALGAAYANLNVQGNFNSQKELLGKAAEWVTGLSVHASASGGIRGELTGTKGHSENALLNKAESFAKDNSFSQSVDNAMRAAKEDNYRVGSEHSNRLATSMASSFDKGERYSEDASASFDTSMSYRHQASLVQQDSVGVNTQASQAFSEWLMTQPSVQHHAGGMGAAEVMTMMQNDLPLAQSYASEFIQQNEHRFMESFQASHSSQAVQSQFQHYQDTIPNQATIERDNHAQHQHVKQAASNVQTGQVSQSAVATTDELLHLTHKQNQDSTLNKGSVIESQVKTVVDSKGVEYVEP